MSTSELFVLPLSTMPWPKTAEAFEAVRVMVPNVLLVLIATLSVEFDPPVIVKSLPLPAVIVLLASVSF